jgi:hypothetical protein
VKNKNTDFTHFSKKREKKCCEEKNTGFSDRFNTRTRGKKQAARKNN